MIHLDNIPIKNIYYMLCYSWNKLDYINKISVDILEQKDLSNLLCRILIKEVNHLIRGGLCNNYIPINEQTHSIKGKINFDNSIVSIKTKQGKIHCTFDEYQNNILENKIIKSTLLSLYKCKEISKESKKEVKKILFNFDGVSNIKVTKKTFNDLKITRENKKYEFIINVCKLYFVSSLIDSNEGSYSFIEFIRDPKKMCSLYEDFLRNFYKKELKNSSVYRERINWCFDSSDEAAMYIPRMETDISVIHMNTKTIIDAKYYTETFSNYKDTKKIHSANLYQMFAYIKNSECNDSVNRNIHGILLYPETSKTVSFTYSFGNHKITIETLNLNTDWTNIHNQLINLFI